MKILGSLLALFMVVWLGVWLLSDVNDSAASDSLPTGPSQIVAKPLSDEPKLEFAFDFDRQNLSVYRCKPCLYAKATTTAHSAHRSSRTTAHAFFDMPDSALKSLKEQVSSARSFLKAEQIVKQAEPEHYRKVMPNGAIMNY